MPCGFSRVLRPFLGDCWRAKYFRSAAETLNRFLTPSAALRRRSPTGEPLDFRPLWVCGRPRPPCALRGRLHASCRIITCQPAHASDHNDQALCARLHAISCCGDGSIRGQMPQRQIAPMAVLALEPCFGFLAAFLDRKPLHGRPFLAVSTERQRLIEVRLAAWSYLRTDRQ